MTLGAGDRSEVANGANGRTGPKSLTALTGFGSRLPHNFFRSAGPRPRVPSGSDGGAVHPLRRSRHLNQFFPPDLFAQVAEKSVRNFSNRIPSFTLPRHAANLHEGTATCRFKRRAEIFTPFEGENFA